VLTAVIFHILKPEKEKEKKKRIRTMCEFRDTKFVTACGNGKFAALEVLRLCPLVLLADKGCHSKAQRWKAKKLR
jgi:hypothetical protein